MRPTTLCLIGVVALAAASTMPAHAERVRNNGQSSGHYFVDFRARPGGVFGHTYVVYGRMDGRGRYTQPRYAGLYPSGPFSQTALLAVLAVPGRISVHATDHERTPKMIYRRRLSPAAYARLTRAVHTQRRTPQAWDLLLYNCNSFAADVATAIGLRTPPTIEFPDDFVRDLYVLNKANYPGPRPHRTTRMRRARIETAYNRDVLFHFDSDTGRVRMWR